MFYEKKNSTAIDSAKIEVGQNFNFPSHFHNSFEFITVTEGEMTVWVDNLQYTVTPSNALLIFPNQSHSLQTNSYSVHILCIFPPHIVKAFANTTRRLLPKSALFSPERFYVDQLFDLISSNSLIKQKGILYALCAEFEKHAEYIESSIESNDLLNKIFDFVENNFSNDCSLSALSKYTSYNDMYISRYFKQHTGIAYIDHVNTYRINMAIYLINNSDKNISDIAFDCGFSSVRHFNRKFKETMGVTPREFRENNIIKNRAYQKSNVLPTKHSN